MIHENQGPETLTEETMEPTISETDGKTPDSHRTGCLGSVC